MLCEQQAHENRERLLAAVDLLDNVTPREHLLRNLIHTWVMCSYAVRDDRHRAKIVLGKMIRNWWDRAEVRPIVRQRPVRPEAAKPTLVVACEVEWHTHVMRRCYRYFLRQLRKRFHVVAVSADTDFQQDERIGWFDELVSPGNVFTLRRDLPEVPVEIREQPAPLRIAVNAHVRKFNYPFLLTLRRIAEQAGRTVEYHLMPNTVGLCHVTLRAQVRRVLEGIAVQVHPRSNFEGYLEILNPCDVSLSPFPFGGENCVLDALMQAIPVVVAEGPEPHERLDGRVMRLAQMPAWLIADNPEQYEMAALQLIRDDGLRCELARQLTEVDIPRRIRDEHEMYTDDFVETVWWMHKNRESLHQRKVWRAEDRDR